MRLACQDKEIGTFYVFTSAVCERMPFYFLRRMLTSVNGDENECPVIFTIHNCMIPNNLMQWGNGVMHC